MLGTLNTLDTWPLPGWVQAAGLAMESAWGQTVRVSSENDWMTSKRVPQVWQL